MYFILIRDGLLVDLDGSKPIYECNYNCRCPPDCQNRLLQNGCTIPVKVKYISTQTGFGLFSTTEIKEASFIIEYIGELITKEEALLRVKKVNVRNSYRVIKLYYVVLNYRLQMYNS